MSPRSPEHDPLIANPFEPLTHRWHLVELSRSQKRTIVAPPTPSPESDARLVAENGVYLGDLHLHGSTDGQAQWRVAPRAPSINDWMTGEHGVTMPHAVQSLRSEYAHSRSLAQERMDAQECGQDPAEQTLASRPSRKDADSTFTTRELQRKEARRAKQAAAELAANTPVPAPAFVPPRFSSIEILAAHEGYGYAVNRSGKAGTFVVAYAGYRIGIVRRHPTNDQWWSPLSSNQLLVGFESHLVSPSLTPEAAAGRICELHQTLNQKAAERFSRDATRPRSMASPMSFE